MKPRIYLNPLPQIEGTSWIDLSQGFYSLLDIEVALIAPKFHLNKRKDELLYAYRNVRVDDKNTKQYLHRFVLEYYEIDAPNEIDHINGNGLDNRLSNLRPATKVENMGNTGMYRNNKSGYLGVFFDKERGKWIAFTGKVHLGRFETPLKAAKVRDCAAIKHFGKFSFDHLNFPVTDYLTSEEIQEMMSK